MIGSIIIGLIVGAIAKLIIGGREPSGFLITMLIGLAGSVVAHFVGVALGFYHQGEGPGFIASTLGAMLLLVIYHKVSGNRSVTSV